MAQVTDGEPISPWEWLARLLKQGSSILELRNVRQQCCDVCRFGGVSKGLRYWIDASWDVALILTLLVEPAADGLQAALGRVIDEAPQQSQRQRHVHP